ncbi:hypothetical protein TorRG33x02_345960, partial [Trema orientale]
TSKENYRTKTQLTLQPSNVHRAGFTSDSGPAMNIVLTLVLALAATPRCRRSESTLQIQILSRNGL